MREINYQALLSLCRTSYEVTGPEALAIRDEWKDYIDSLVPKRFQKCVNRNFTRISGVASTSDFDTTNGYTPKTTIRWWLWRHLAFTAAGILVSIAALKMAPGIEKLLGVPFLLYSGRSLQSGYGHVLSHIARHKTHEDKALGVCYELLQGAVAGSSLELYQRIHPEHHKKSTRAGDPDVQFLYGRLRCDFSSRRALLRSLCSLGTQWRFAGDRIKVLLLGAPPTVRAKVPALRRIYNIVILGVLPIWLGATGGTVYLATVFFGYQACALAGMACLHSWNAPVEGMDARGEALSVTINRLNLPQPGVRGVAELIMGWIIYCFLFPQDRHHQLHHAADKGSIGPGTPWTLTRLILEGKPTRQTLTVRAMFAANFESNRRNPHLSKLLVNSPASNVEATHV